MRGIGAALERVLAGALGVLSWLVLPLGLLLFLQWPLRDLVQAYSREANDLAQILFALFVAASVTAATRAGTHLSTDALARHYSARTRTIIRRTGQLLALAPWAVVVILTSRGMVLASIAQREGFPETSNTGYFIVRLALWLLAGLMLLAIAVDLMGADRCERDRHP